MISGLSIPTVRFFDTRTKHIYSAGQDKKPEIDIPLLRSSVQRLRTRQLTENERIEIDKPDKKAKAKLEKRKRKPVAPPVAQKPLPGVKYHSVLTGVEPVEVVASLFEEEVLGVFQP